MSTHNIGFYEDLTKIIFELSSNTHLISSADISMIGCHGLSVMHSLLEFFWKSCKNKMHTKLIRFTLKACCNFWLFANELLHNRSMEIICALRKVSSLVTD